MMSDTDDLPQLVARLRTGDESAAVEFLSRYEAAIRRTVRMRMWDQRMRRIFDSSDVCQSVLGSFLVRLTLGEYELESSEQMMKLLFSMTRNKVSDYVRRQRTESRDHRRVAGGDIAEIDLIGASETPSQIVAGAEILQQVRQRLDDDERCLAEMRSAGLSWQEISEQLGNNPEALRKKHSRSINRVLAELGLEELQSAD